MSVTDCTPGSTCSDCKIGYNAYAYATLGGQQQDYATAEARSSQRHCSHSSCVLCEGQSVWLARLSLASCSVLLHVFAASFKAYAFGSNSRFAMIDVQVT